jgi:MscS family membrane protein
MKVKLDRLFRGALLFCLVLAAFGIWAGAQTETNRSADGATNQAATHVAPDAMGGHYLTFGLDRVVPLSERTLLGEPLWKYVASLVYILLAFVISKLLDLTSGVFLKKLTAKTETKLDDVLLELLHGPIKVVAFVLLLHIGLNLFDWPVRARSYLSKTLVLIVAGSLTYLAVKLVNLVLDLWQQRHAHEADRKFNDQLFSMIRRTLNAFVVVVAILVTAQNVGVNITAVITSLSIGGLAVGLAAQDTLGNLFGAIAVFADKPFHVGDQIRLADTEGIVESVGMRSTRLRNSEGHLVAIPNKTVGNATIVNITKRSNIKTTMNVLLPHDLKGDKIKRALAILQEIYRGYSMTQDVWISFNQFAGRNLNVMIIHWWKGTDYQKYLAGMQEMNLAVKERFDAEGISFA